MSIFHTIKKAIVKKAIKRLLHKFAERHEAKRVLAAASTDKLGKIFAPGSGRVIMMADIPDDVFGEGNIGDGCGILFEESTLVSPVTGAVSAIMSGQHVLGITSDDGIEVVLHVGFDDTKVALESFSRLVEQDQRVTVGDPVISIAREDGCDYLAILAIANTEDYDCVNVVVQDSASVGEEILETVPQNLRNA